jgi:hypothetical protein
MTRPDWFGCLLSLFAISVIIGLLIRVLLFGWE